MQPEKDILLITPGFASDENDTSCIPFLQDFVFALQKATGPEHIRIIATQYPYTKKPYVWHGVEVIPLFTTGKMRWIRAWKFFRAMRRVERLCRGGNFIIHSFWLNEATYMGSLLAKKFHTRLIASIMGQDARADNHYLYTLPFHRIEVLAFNRQMSELFRYAVKRPVRHVIPLAVHRITVPQNTARDIDLLYATAFSPLKRPSLFIEVLRMLRNENPNIRAVMCGNGVLIPEINSLILKYRLEKNITLTGALPREEVLAYMMHSKILLHTSEFESQSTVMEEALASGMHVLCFDIGRNNEAKRITVCNDVNAMIQRAFEILHATPDYTPEQLRTTEDTIPQYLEIYRG